eukprot:g19033.t1
MLLTETQPRLPGGGSGSKRRPWTLLKPTVLWSLVILSMAPSFYGFAGGLGGLPMRASAGGSGVEAADLPESSGTKGVAGAAIGARSSPFVAASWLKERVRDGKRRVQMQVMSMVPETNLDAKCFEDAPVPAEEREFLVNGWRWHSRAVLRDIARFRRAALLAADVNRGRDEHGEAAVQRVVKCYGFMWTFSFTKLHNTEMSLFFPWLRELIPEEALPPLADFDREREGVVKIANKIGQFVVEAEKASAAKASPRAALLRCADLAEELEAKAARLARVQEAAIVPATAAYVTSKQQWKFNDKVIFSLGLVDAQVFLVAMHDAIKSDREEFNKFRKNVPKFARALIPTWRRVLYLPRAGCLEETADVAVAPPSVPRSIKRSCPKPRRTNSWLCSGSTTSSPCHVPGSNRVTAAAAWIRGRAEGAAAAAAAAGSEADGWDALSEVDPDAPTQDPNEIQLDQL